MDLQHLSTKSLTNKPNKRQQESPNSNVVNSNTLRNSQNFKDYKNATFATIQVTAISSPTAAANNGGATINISKLHKNTKSASQINVNRNNADGNTPSSINIEDNNNIMIMANSDSKVDHELYLRKEDLEQREEVKKQII